MLSLCHITNQRHVTIAYTEYTTNVYFRRHKWTNCAYGREERKYKNRRKKRTESTDCTDYYSVSKVLSSSMLMTYIEWSHNIRSFTDKSECSLKQEQWLFSFLFFFVCLRFRGVRWVLANLDYHHRFHGMHLFRSSFSSNWFFFCVFFSFPFTILHRSQTHTTTFTLYTRSTAFALISSSYWIRLLSSSSPYSNRIKIWLLNECKCTQIGGRETAGRNCITTTIK